MEMPLLVVTQQALSRYHGNATNSLLRNSNPRYYGNAATRCYATGTVTLPWKCNKLIITQQ
jgi:hypothetical protein